MKNPNEINVVDAEVVKLEVVTENEVESNRGKSHPYLFNFIVVSINKIKESLVDLKIDMQKGFNGVDEKLIKIENRIESIKSKL